MKRDDSSPQAYRDDVEGELSLMLETIRDVVFRVAPDVEEVIEYGMLGYPGLCNLAAQKNYVALYVKPTILAGHAADFPGVDCGKSCLRFKKQEHIDPDALGSLLADVLNAG
jgi:uncharacterized protein YdhG (YjbR/CyaY superfamily)